MKKITDKAFKYLSGIHIMTVCNQAFKYLSWIHTLILRICGRQIKGDPLLKHIILDIDYTLLFTELKNSDEDNLEKMKINLRPNLKQFMYFLFKNFKSVSIWSAGGYIYVNYIVKYLKDKKIIPNGMKFRFVFTCDQCTIEVNYGRRGVNRRHSEVLEIKLKDLRKKVFIMYKDMNSFNTMIVDDTESTFRENYGNALHIKKYMRINLKDNCLEKVAEKLFKIQDKNLNFRDYKNRTINWNNKVSKDFIF